MRTVVLITSCLLWMVSSAQAIMISSGSHQGRARLGVSTPIDVIAPIDLSPARAYLSIDGSYDYVLSSWWSLTGSLRYQLNIGSTNVMSVGAGARFRYEKLPLPLHPHVSLELVCGRLLNVRNVSLNYLGGRVNLGLDYYLNRQLSLGLVASYNLGYVLGSTAYEDLGLYLMAGYLF